MPNRYAPKSGSAFFDNPSSFDTPAQPDDPAAIAPAAGASIGPSVRPVWRRLTKLHVLIVASIAALGVVVPMSIASADPSSNDWYRLRMCESGNNYQINTGNGYYGAYQFNLSTWRSVGGTGYPNQSAPAVQDALALKLYRMRGWQPWTCASIVGLREDKDARSGRTSDIVFPTAGSTPKTPAAPTTAKSGVKAPPWPNTQYWSLGDHSSTIARFQAQLHKRGSTALTGTGQFGANTLAAVNRLQRLNGLPQTGLLGPNTWKLAWTGKF
jgi:peptidoglycan hydrolase-like protein with peptidoglycan-binding domain